MGEQRGFHTKIVATISERLSLDTLRAMHANGMCVARLNVAHLDVEKAATLIRSVREVSHEIAILVDTKGPEVRTVSMADLAIKCGERIWITGNAEIESPENCIRVNHPRFAEEVPLSSRILIDDGALELSVTGKRDAFLECIAKNDSVVRGNKSVNTPGVNFQLPSLTEKDKDFLRLCAEMEVDFVAHSFVRNAQDVLDVKAELNRHGGDFVRVIAKIENQQGVENIEEILDEAYGVLVARGDLGVEIPPEEVPLIQKHLIKTCIRRAKPVIVATQMLESMIHNPRPTRAEISDVANAVFDGADAVMLSGETAYGKYPVEAVQMMARIARSAETEQYSIPRKIQGGFAPLARHYIAKLAIQAATDLKVKAVVIPSRTGQTVLEAASYRQEKPIYAMCNHPTLMRQMSLSYGVYPVLVDRCRGTAQIACSVQILRDRGWVHSKDLIVLVLSSFGAPDGEFNQLHINLVENIIEHG